MRLLKFISKYGVYTFPGQISGKDNFGGLTTATSRVPGMNGGFDDFGDGRSPQEIGDLPASWWLLPDESKLPLRTMKEAVKAMQGWGKGYLFQLNEDAQDPKRDVMYTRARLNNVDMSQNVRDMPHLRQKVSVNFQANDPVWYGCKYNPDYDASHNADGWWYFDNGHNFNESGLTFGGYRKTASLTAGAVTTVQVYNSGDHTTRPTLRFVPDTGVMENLTVRRLSQDGSDTSVEEWCYTGTVEEVDVLVINCEKSSVIHETIAGDTDGYASWTRRVGFGFHELNPGLNTFEIEYETGTSADVYFEYPDAWY